MSLKGMIVAVGGSAAPIVFSLNGDKPALVLFVVSEGSRPQVEEQILPELEDMPQYEYLQISDHENIETCYKEMREGISRWLLDRQLDQDDVRVDYTGGTKSMSAAVALASVERFGDFKYVASYRRTKAGLGTGVSGYEYHARSSNPWNALAVRELERANWLLGEYHAESAAEVLTQAADKCDEAHKSRLKSFAQLADALAAADRFQFRQAENKFNQSRRELEHTLEYPTYQAMLSLLDQWKAIAVQSRPDEKTPGRETLLELLANAERRAKQARYDDATGRLYRAIELYAQQLVKQAFSADLGKPRLDDFPATRYEEVLEKFGEPNGEGQYKLGVKKLFQALEFSDDDDLRGRTQLYSHLENHLQIRNSSLLAHGLQPVSKDSFDRFLIAALQVLRIDESDIPRWPTLELNL